MRGEMYAAWFFSILNFVALAIITASILKLAWQNETASENHAEILRILKGITMTQAETVAALTAANAQLTKIAIEQAARFATQSALIEAQTKVIEDLKAAIASGGDTSPEVASALATLQANLQSLDDTIPDAPTP